MFSNLFRHKKPVPAALLQYGFVLQNGRYSCTVPVLNGAFALTVRLDDRGGVDTTLVETATGEEYFLYKTSAQGAFVGGVRAAVSDALADIADRCFETDYFRQPQTLRLLAHAAAAYGDTPQFLWKDSGNGVLRRRDTDKWYAVFMTVPKSKLGIDSAAPTEIVNLHADPAAVAALVRQPGFYPGWHMNKKHWVTALLDGTVPDQTLHRLLAGSYQLAKK